MFKKGFWKKIQFSSDFWLPDWRPGNFGRNFGWGLILSGDNCKILGISIRCPRGHPNQASSPIFGGPWTGSWQGRNHTCVLPLHTLAISSSHIPGLQITPSPMYHISEPPPPDTSSPLSSHPNQQPSSATDSLYNPHDGRLLFSLATALNNT